MQSSSMMVGLLIVVKRQFSSPLRMSWWLIMLKQFKEKLLQKSCWPALEQVSAIIYRYSIQIYVGDAYYIANRLQDDEYLKLKTQHKLL